MDDLCREHINIRLFRQVPDGDMFTLVNNGRIADEVRGAREEGAVEKDGIFVIKSKAIRMKFRPKLRKIERGKPMSDFFCDVLKIDGPGIASNLSFMMSIRLYDIPSSGARMKRIRPVFL